MDGSTCSSQVWPGTDFEFAFGVNKGEEIEAALALLGASPRNSGNTVADISQIHPMVSLLDIS